MLKAHAKLVRGMLWGQCLFNENSIHGGMMPNILKPIDVLFSYCKGYKESVLDEKKEKTLFPQSTFTLARLYQFSNVEILDSFTST